MLYCIRRVLRSDELTVIYLLITLSSLSSAQQLIELRGALDTVLPSFYLWMERNAHICELGQSSPAFLSDADAQQFNCDSKCGEPLETLRACARMSPEMPPDCEQVPDLCVKDFVQEFILQLRRFNSKLIQRALNNDMSAFLGFGGSANDQTTLARIVTASSTPTTAIATPSTISTFPTTTTTSPTTTTTTATSTTPSTTTTFTTTSTRLATTSLVFATTTIDLGSGSVERSFLTEEKKVQIDGEVAREIKKANSTGNTIVDKLLGRFQAMVSRTPGPLFNELSLNENTNGTMEELCPPDGDKACTFWAQINECQQNKEFMHRVCKRACAVCVPAAEKPLKETRQTEIRVQ